MGGGRGYIPQFCKNTIHFLFRSNAHNYTIGDLISSEIFSIGLDDPWLRSSQISTDIGRNYIWLRGFYFRFSNFVYARAGRGMREFMRTGRSFVPNNAVLISKQGPTDRSQMSEVIYKDGC